MADKKRILVVTQEFHPYTTASDIAKIAHEYSQYMQESGTEIRILMPRFGVINERRHRLHEVVRLSGMNITVDDEDYPLIIKVASLPGTRMQIYFLDNDEFFKRKQMFSDAEGTACEDNMERMIFFCKGVIETVKKFGWSPDIVHCHGWMTSLIPAYLKNHFKNEPIFQNARFIQSIYNADKNITDALATNFETKALNNQLEESVVSNYVNNGNLDLNAGAATYADGVVTLEESNTFSNSDAPVFTHTQNEENNDWSELFNFFESFLYATEEENA